MLMSVPFCLARCFILAILLPCITEGSQNQKGAFTTISTSISKFNLDEKLNLFAFVQASSSVFATWSVDCAGKSISLNSLTPTQLTIPEADATSLFSFPLSVPPYSFRPDGDVTFRLTVRGVGFEEDSVRAFSEVTLYVNGPPVGGVMEVFPRIGTALETPFVASTMGWSDDSSDYPLSYGYSYVIDRQLHHLTEKSHLSNVTTVLPMGREHAGYSVAVLVRVYDSAMACANATTAVIVIESKQRRVEAVQQFVRQRLKRASLSARDASEALVAVSSAAHVLNHRNCSLASSSFCQSLNRSPCGEEAQRCGGCLLGFSGVTGPSNIKCHTSRNNNKIRPLVSGEGAAASGGGIGAYCCQDEDCLLGKCSEGQCAAPSLVCPSINEEQCSGRGKCVFIDHSAASRSTNSSSRTCGVIRDTCSVADVHCAAMCRCSEGFEGEDCSIDLKELQDRSETRAALCSAVIRAATAGHPSPLMVESLIAALELSYRREEVTDAQGRGVCLEALWLVSQLAAQNSQLKQAVGHDSGVLLLQTASRFVPMQWITTSGSSGGGGGELEQLQCLDLLPSALLYDEPEEQEGLQTGDILTEVVSNVASFVLKSIPNGHSDVSLVAEHIRMTIVRGPLFQLEGRTLTPPPSPLEALLNLSLPSLSFASPASDDCNAGEGYAQLSVSQWTRSPYSNSSNLVSPLFRSEAFVSATASHSRSASTAQYRGGLSELLLDQEQEPYPDYFITLPFTAPQSFSFDLEVDLQLDEDGSPLPFQNQTFPVCHYYSGDTYIPCGNCNISSYDNLTVTYACTDVSFVCGLEGMNSRLDYDESQFSVLEIPYGADSSEGGNRSYYYSGTQGSYYSSNGGVTLNQLAAIVIDIRISFAKILSTFRFRMINFKIDAPMLTFVFGLAMGIVCGFVLFARWDRFDHDELIYANINAKNRRAARIKRTEAIMKQNQLLKENKAVRRRWFSRNNFMSLLSKRKGRALSGEKKDLPDEVEADLVRRQTQLEYYHILSALSIDMSHDMYVEAVDFDPIENFIDAAVPGHEDFSLIDLKGKKKMSSEEQEEDDEENKKQHKEGNKRSSSRKYAAAGGGGEEGGDGSDEEGAGGGELTLTSIGAALGMDLDLSAEKSAALALAAVSQSMTFFNVVLFRHDYFAIFNRYTGSLGQSRVLRFSSLSLKILLCLLLDTLFFSVFFPDTGLCESFKTKADCLERFNLASNSNLCMWTKPVYHKRAGHCSLAPPPQNVFFTLMVVLVTVICAAPVNIMFNNLRLKICSKRPDVESIGMDVNYWLNSSSQVVHDITMSLLEFHARLNAVPVNEEAVEEERQRHPGVILRKGTTKINTNTNKVTVELDEIDFVSRTALEKTESAAAEAEHLYASIVALGRSNANHAELAWGSTVDETKRKEARIRAMDRELRVNLHGAFLPLTLKQSLFYGTTKRRLIAKLSRARKTEREISEQLENIDEFDYHDRDTLLLQRFVLEQFSATKRYCLRRQLFNFRSSTPFKINPLLWAAGWLMMFLFMLFFMYWILAWGVLSGKKTFKSWGWNFGLQFAQDVLVTEVLKMYVLYVISMFSMKPQLNNIYRKLNHLAILSAQEQGDSSGGVGERMKEIRVVQYLSPACRVARKDHALELAGAKILRQMDDLDQEDCQKDSHIRMNVLGYMFFGIASIISMYSDFWSDFVMEVTIPCVSIGFVLASYYLYKATITTFAMFFFFVICCLLLKRYYDNLKAKDLMRRKMGINNGAANMEGLLHKKRKSRRVKLLMVRYRDVEALLVRWFDFIRWVYKLRHFRFNEKQLRQQKKEDNQWMQINSIFSQTDDMDHLPLSDALGHTSVHIPKEVGRMKASDQKSVHYRGGALLKRQRPDVITRLLNRHLLNCPADCGLDISTHAPSVDSLWEDSPSHSRQSSPVHSTRSGRSNSSHRSRVDTLLFEPAFDVEKLAVFADDNEKRWPLMRPMMYRFTHLKTSNPMNALVRMFHKHLGKISQLQDVVDQSPGSEEVERYFKQITQYQSYDDTEVSVEAFSLIMSEIFNIYTPGGSSLSRAELAETMQMYKQWVEENPYPADATPCREFIRWFLALKDVIVKSHRVESQFDLDNVHDAYGASKNVYRRRRVVIEYSDGSMSSTSESFVNTSDGESEEAALHQSSESSYSSSESSGGYSYHSSDFSTDDSRRLHIGTKAYSSETSSNSSSRSYSASGSESHSSSSGDSRSSYSGSYNVRNK